jgi:serine/threonine protein kinase
VSCVCWGLLLAINDARDLRSDFGTSFFLTDNIDATPMLVSRFYRPPEVILGVEYKCPIDMWSVGVVLVEIFTGKLIYPVRARACVCLLNVCSHVHACCRVLIIMR